jgi:pentatricopeptide repeat protein
MKRAEAYVDFLGSPTQISGDFEATVVTYTSLLVGYASSGDIDAALDVFMRRMPLKRKLHDAFLEVPFQSMWARVRFAAEYCHRKRHGQCLDRRRTRRRGFGIAFGRSMLCFSFAPSTNIFTVFIVRFFTFR